MAVVKTVYDTDYVDAAHLAKAMENHRIVVIKAVCGMGKSTAIEQVVRGHNGPTMAVACKQTHAQDMAQQFSLEHYKTLDSEFPPYQRLYDGPQFVQVPPLGHDLCYIGHCYPR